MNLKDPEDLFQFVQKDDFTVSGQPKFSCTICWKKFQGRSATRNHIESIHYPGLFKYICDLCGKDMISKSALNYHITMSHNKINWFDACEIYYHLFTSSCLF